MICLRVSFFSFIFYTFFFFNLNEVSLFYIDLFIFAFPKFSFLWVIFFSSGGDYLVDYNIQDKIADILKQSRYKSGCTQDTIAEKLGVTRKTVQNWESGKSMPDIAQMYNWFNAIQLPPQPYMLRILYPDVDSGKFDNESEMDKALLKFAQDLPTHAKQKLLFILEGKHGSSPISVIDMMVANLQTPLSDRLNICQSIILNYEMAEELDILTDKNAIRPSVINLKESLSSAMLAVKKRLNSYLK